MKIRAAASRLIAHVSWFGFLLVCAPLLARAADGEPGTAQILHMLDYIAVDYAGAVNNGSVANADEYAEQLEFAQRIASSVDELPAPSGIAKESFAKRAGDLVQLVRDKQPGAQVAAVATALSQDLIRAYRVVTAPRRAPNLGLGAQLFAENCASCHGAAGFGDGPLAASLQPKPSNFHDRARQEQLSLFGLHSTITLGVQGTAMQGYARLSDEARWALAFYVGSLSATEAESARGAALFDAGTLKSAFANLTDLTTTTPLEAAKHHGEDGRSLLAYLKTHPQKLTAAGESPLALSARMLNESLAAYAKGDRATAQQLAVTAYLDGYELVEARLDGVDKDFRARVEREMMQYRNLLKSGAPTEQLAAQVKNLEGLLDQVQAKLHAKASSATATFLSALVILLREGLEAILIVAGIAAFLAKVGRRDGLNYVHAGWIVALLCGIGTWYAASRFITISGANRELTEGVTALISAAVLLYVGYWLHGKSHADAWQQYIRGKLKGALSSKTLWMLALLSFFAVYREVFETVLFYQALWVQAQAGGQAPIVFGFVSAAVALAVIGLLIARFSVRLPLRLFFGVSSAVIAVMAVIFVGKGIANLQEAGTLSADPVNVPELPLLGIYPNLEGLLLQAAVICLIVGAYVYSNYALRRNGQAQTR